MPVPSPFHGRQVRIAVLTSDMKLARNVVEEAVRRGLKADHVTNPGDIPLAAKAVVVKKGEFKEITHGNPVYADEYTSPTAIVDRAIEVAYSKDKIRKVVVAVDPGKTMGAAFLADNILLRMESYTDYKHLTSSVSEFFKNHPNSKQAVIIGSGAPEFREKLLKTLLSKTSSINPQIIHSVPEKNTTKLAKGWDEAAAALLLRRHGKKG
ncbi:MAG: hypothetical protein QW470_00025 [Candidatus Caldarchaeum sp.]